MGYTAQAVGNHDFDFGSVDSPTARQLPGDLRGALKARAAQARYPFLAANLIDEATGRPVEWPNVRPSVARGCRRGQSRHRGRHDDRCAEVDPRSQRAGTADRAAWADDRRGGVEASSGRRRSRHRRFPCGRALRSIRSARGSVVVRFGVRDLSGGEKPAAWVGGRHRRRPHARRARPSSRRHRHHPALLAWPGVRSRRRRLRSEDPAASRGIQLFAPRQVCAQQDPSTGNCVPATASAVPTKYEGRAVTPDPAIVQAMAPALQRVHELQATTLGVSLDCSRFVESASRIAARKPLCRGAARRGAGRGRCGHQQRGARLWADLPDGPITFGQLYDVFPFDNRVARITLSGAELARWLAAEIRQGRRGALGISGVDVRASCLADGIHVDLLARPERIRRRRSVARRDDRRADAQRQPGVAGSLGGVGPTENRPGRAGSGRGLVSAAWAPDAERTRSHPQPTARVRRPQPVGCVA